jgi:short-subunit dehydrogenase
MRDRLAMVTGASSGIGYELLAICAQEGFDLLIAAGRPEIFSAAIDAVTWNHQAVVAHVTRRP